MKKIIFGIVALLIATFGLYAFTNTGDSKTVETEALNVYHYVGENEDGEIIFVSGEPTGPGCELTGEKPCRFQSTATLTSPMSPEDIQSQATVTEWRD